MTSEVNWSSRVAPLIENGIATDATFPFLRKSSGSETDGISQTGSIRGSQILAHVSIILPCAVRGLSVIKTRPRPVDGRRPDQAEWRSQSGDRPSTPIGFGEAVGLCSITPI